MPYPDLLSALDLMAAPAWQMGLHQGLEEAAVVGDTQVQEPVGDHETLKSGQLVAQVGSRGEIPEVTGSSISAAVLAAWNMRLSWRVVRGRPHKLKCPP